jgi:hypothetical protein
MRSGSKLILLTPVACASCRPEKGRRGRCLPCPVSLHRLLRSDQTRAVISRPRQNVPIEPSEWQTCRPSLPDSRAAAGNSQAAFRVVAALALVAVC